MVEIFCIDPAVVFKFWPHAKQLVFSASERTGLSDPFVTEYEVLVGDQLLWIIWDGREIRATATTRLSEGECTVTTCGGKGMKEWLPLFARIQRYAKEEGCSLCIPGRRGWERALSRYGIDTRDIKFLRAA